MPDPNARFADALSAAPTRSRGFDALGTLVDDTLATRLFTVMTLDHARGVARRAWSNRPDAYPVSGEKEIEPNPWYAQVVARGEPFVANTLAEIAEVFPDAELIGSLGCASVLNLPVTRRGQVVGTLNLLEGQDHFTPDRVAEARALLTLPALACFLLPSGGSDLA